MLRSMLEFSKTIIARFWNEEATTQQQFLRTVRYRRIENTGMQYLVCKYIFSIFRQNHAYQKKTRVLLSYLPLMVKPSKTTNKKAPQGCCVGALSINRKECNNVSITGWPAAKHLPYRIVESRKKPSRWSPTWGLGDPASSPPAHRNTCTFVNKKWLHSSYILVYFEVYLLCLLLSISITLLQSRFNIGRFYVIGFLVGFLIGFLGQRRALIGWAGRIAHPSSPAGWLCFSLYRSRSADLIGWLVCVI